jgi:hypothetical protein
LGKPLIETESEPYSEGVGDDERIFGFLSIREGRRCIVFSPRRQRRFLVDNDSDIVESMASDTKWIERRVLTRIKAECVKCVLGNRHCQHDIPSRLEEESRKSRGAKIRSHVSTTQGFHL